MPKFTQVVVVELGFEPRYRETRMQIQGGSHTGRHSARGAEICRPHLGGRTGPCPGALKSESHQPPGPAFWVGCFYYLQFLFFNALELFPERLGINVYLYGVDRLQCVGGSLFT